MTLPDKFKFTTYGDTYTAERHESEAHYVISWVSYNGVQHTNYATEVVARRIKLGDWQILAESFPDIYGSCVKICNLIIEKRVAGVSPTDDEVAALIITRTLINRLLDDRN